jgi:hypothetical protein
MSAIASGIIAGIAPSTPKGAAMATATQGSEKVRELRLRRMAERQGLALHKSRRRDPHALDFGHYWLTKGTTLAGTRERGLDHIEAYLRGER